MSSTGKTILIVEDEASLNEAYQTILAQSGHMILSAFNGEEALEIVEDNKVDLILLDLRMPVMDGLEFLKEYSPGKDRAKVIIFSNYDMQKEIDEAYAHGADKYILKSWASPKELIKIVDDTLNQ